MFDPRAVPDLDRDRDAQDRRQHDQRVEPRPRGGIRLRQVEDAPLTELVTERLAENLEPDRRGKQNHHPVDLKPSHQSPHVTMEIGEEERRKVPDGFFRANLTQAATRESAADGKGKRDGFAGDERRNTDQRSHDRAGVRTGQKPGQKCPGERQIGGVVVDQNPRDDPCRQRNAKARRKDESFRPVALLGQQDASEPRKPDEHRRQDGDDRDLDDQGRQEELPGRQRFRGLWHLNPSIIPPCTASPRRTVQKARSPSTRPYGMLAQGRPAAGSQ